MGFIIYMEKNTTQNWDKDILFYLQQIIFWNLILFFSDILSKVKKSQPYSSQVDKSRP